MADYPDLYTDGFAVSVGPYGVTVTLQRSDPEVTAGGISDRTETVGRVRMSLPLAKALAQALNDAAAQQANVLQQPESKTKN